MFCLTAVSIASRETVHIYLTSDNFHEFYDSIPDRIFEIFSLAEVEPLILQPCDTSIWFIGDTIVVSWQGAAVLDRCVYCEPTDTPLEDSTYYIFYLPYWEFRMEIYKDGAFIDNIFPSASYQHFPLEYLNDTNTCSFYGRRPRPRLDISEQLDQWSPGTGYQIRIVSWNRFPDLDNYIEIWSDQFEIAEPWLEIVIPDSSTMWREDSSDVFVRFNRHGSFGYRYPERTSPAIYLVRYGNPVDIVSGYCYNFINGELSDNSVVEQDWGNGDGYQIYLELRDDRRFYSDYFSIIGCTISITIHACNTFQSHPQWSRNDSVFEFEWTPSSGETVSVGLYKIVQEGFDNVDVLVANTSNDGYYVYDGSPNSDWGNGWYHLKIEDSDSNYGWSDQFYIFHSATIP